MKRMTSLRLLYRRIEKSDFPFFYSLYSDPEVMRYTYLDVCDEPKSLEIFREVCEEKVFTYFMVSEKQNNGYIGFVFYNNILDHPE